MVKSLWLGTPSYTTIMYKDQHPMQFCIRRKMTIWMALLHLMPYGSIILGMDNLFLLWDSTSCSCLAWWTQGMITDINGVDKVFKLNSFCMGICREFPGCVQSQPAILLSDHRTTSILNLRLPPKEQSASKEILIHFNLQNSTTWHKQKGAENCALFTLDWPTVLCNSQDCESWELQSNIFGKHQVEKG